MSRRTGRPKGRPTKLDQVVSHDDQGRPITCGDLITQAVRAGNYIETAAAMAGVHKSSIYTWLSDGARVSQALNQGKRRGEFTRYERLAAGFSDAVVQAQAEATAHDVALTAQLAAGGYQRVVETVKVDGDGKTIEASRRVETAEPDGAMLRWRLERRTPELFGPTQRVEVSGPEGQPIELSIADRRANLLADLDKLAGKLTEDTAALLNPPLPEPADDRQLVPAPPEVE